MESGANIINGFDMFGGMGTYTGTGTHRLDDNENEKLKLNHLSIVNGSRGLHFKHTDEPNE